MPDVRSDVLVCSHSARTTEAQVASGRELRVREFGPRVLACRWRPRCCGRSAAPTADLVHVHMPYPLGELAALVGAGDPDRVLVPRRRRAAGPLAVPLPAAGPGDPGPGDAIIVGHERIAHDSPLFGARRPIDIIPYGVDVQTLDPALVGAEERAAVRRRYQARTGRWSSPWAGPSTTRASAT